MNRLIFILMAIAILTSAIATAQNQITRPKKQTTEQTTGTKQTKQTPAKKRNNSSNGISNNNISSSNVHQETIKSHDEFDPIIRNMINNMVYVEGGSFMMGSDDVEAQDTEKPMHKVTVKTFSIGRYEVTQKEWKAVMGNNPSYFKGDDLPVENVSLEDCLEFIKKLNSITDRNFRLPTEEEWEYAARGGNQSNGYKHSGSNDINNVAWYDGNSEDKTHNVGTKESNELGLYDMSGNVWEWTSSRWSKDYSHPRNGFPFVIRGGSWCNPALRVSFRDDNVSSFNYEYLGLRLAL